MINIFKNYNSRALYLLILVTKALLEKKLDGERRKGRGNLVPRAFPYVVGGKSPGNEVGEGEGGGEEGRSNSLVIASLEE